MPVRRLARTRRSRSRQSRCRFRARSTRHGPESTNRLNPRPQSSRVLRSTLRGSRLRPRRYRSNNATLQPRISLRRRNLDRRGARAADTRRGRLLRKDGWTLRIPHCRPNRPREQPTGHLNLESRRRGPTPHLENEVGCTRRQSPQENPDWM
jgi:hypothetical protein